MIVINIKLKNQNQIFFYDKSYYFILDKNKWNSNRYRMYVFL